MKKIALLSLCFFITLFSFAQKDSVVSKKDRKKDVLLQTSLGDIVIRLSDSTPLHRDNFLKLVKTKYYDSVLFHRVIKGFMIQGGDPNSKTAKQDERLGFGGPSYKVPAEFKPFLFHKKGVIAAARDGNPEKASSGSQFYIVHGKIFSDAELDMMEAGMQGKKIPATQREIYKTVGGTPQLDQGYTVFGEVIKGLEVVDSIAVTPTRRERPVTDIKIIKATLIKRKKR
jgi:cyclophilin family peptidyl-prolyl cis-trans isomerase